MRIELSWPLDRHAQEVQAAGPQDIAARALVLDTNIVLDLLVFADPATALLRRLLQTGALHWVATAPMREELERVLAYGHIAPRVAFYGLSTASVLAAFDAQVHCVPVAACVPAVVCKDADDQRFLDLAAAHGAVLLSKDRAVLALRKRLHSHGAVVGTVLVAKDAKGAALPL